MGTKLVYIIMGDYMAGLVSLVLQSIYNYLFNNCWLSINKLDGKSRVTKYPLFYTNQILGGKSLPQISDKTVGDKRNNLQ